VTIRLGLETDATNGSDKLPSLRREINLGSRPEVTSVFLDSIALPNVIAKDGSWLSV
jgi:hypothetical protein